MVADTFCNEIMLIRNLGGWLAAVLVILSTIKINDLNLYAASLGISNFLDTVFGIKMNRAVLTIVIGLFRNGRFYIGYTG